MTQKQNSTARTHISRTRTLTLLLAAAVALSTIAGVASAAATTDLTASITDGDNTLEPGETTTVEIVVDNASSGVGSGTLGVELANPGVASITDTTIVDNAPISEKTIANDTQSASFRYFGVTDPPTGSVTVVEVTLQAEAAGSTDVTVGANNQNGQFTLTGPGGSPYEIDATNEATLTVNTPPEADVDVETVPPGDGAPAGGGVQEETDVTLDASASSDPDGDALSYTWTQTGGPSVNLSDTSAAGPTFTAPSVDNPTTLVFEVAVSDGQASDTDDIEVQIVPTNTPPEADAGESQTVDERTSVTLDASASSDPDGDDLSYAWTQTGGPSATLSNTSVAQPTLTAPEIPEETTLTFEVTVSDGQATDTDNVTVTVETALAPIGDLEDPPTDPDSDGEFEDLNGDGSVDVGDAQALFANDETDTIQNNPELFDYNGDDSVNVGDAQRLFAIAAGAFSP